MKYDFILAQSLGDLRLNYNKQQLINILGEPDCIEYYSDGPLPYDDPLENECLIYRNLGLTVGFYFNDDNEYVGLNISTKCIIYNNLDWYLLSQKEILSIIKTIYKQYNLKYKFEYEKIRYIKEAFTSEEYIFDELGISLFFDDGKLSNVFISKPEDELILPQPKKKPKVKQYQLEPLETDLFMVSESKTEYKRSKKI